MFQTTISTTTEMPTKSEVEWVRWATVSDEDFHGMPEVKLSTEEKEQEHEILIWLKENYFYVAIGGSIVLIILALLFLLCCFCKSSCCKKETLPQPTNELSMEENGLLENQVNNEPQYASAEVSQLIAESAV